MSSIISPKTRKGPIVNRSRIIMKGCFEKMDITINGKHPADIQIIDERVFFRLVKCASGIDRLALGESYMDGQWNCDDLMEFFDKLLSVKQIVFNPISMFITNSIHMLPFRLFNLHTKSRNKKDVASHYDMGNEMFRAMLGRTMNYSCAYWIRNSSLDSPIENKSENQLNKSQLCSNIDEAQMNKMLLIGKKLNLQPGMRVLDIGCGWGTMAKFLAINFDVNVIGVTISNEQYEYAINNDVKAQDLDYLRVPGFKSQGIGKFEFRLQDYRDVSEKYDRIYCIEMLEHVGFKNYREYFRIVHRCLKDDGLYLLHVIGRHDYIPSVDPFIHKYIFTGFMIPRHQQLINCFDGKFVVEDLHNLGYCFYRTLAAWYDNFRLTWPQLKKTGYDERFYRMFSFYLCLCGGLFKKRHLNLWHIVLSKNGSKNGYTSYR